MIPQETIDKILEEADVVEVVGDFVQLKKRGSNYLGCCPFHNEKTPSFTVSPQKGIYKCFGCGASGNSLKFVMENNQLSYPEALRYLADKYKIEIEETFQSNEEKQKQEKSASLHIVNNFANEHFKDNLFNSEEGQNIGLAYFKERGFRKHTIEKFELGYSIDKAKHFTEIALQKQYDIEYLKELGLTSKNDYDFYRGRVMFPIHSVAGKVIGFGGRTLRNDKKTAKYFNSPESTIYHKSKVLYGLFQAKKAIANQDECFLVEGYTDVISLSQAGVENVVASSGTALTEGQIRLIKRFTPNITVLYDGDAAGIKAAFRGIDLILEQDMNVKVVLLPDGEDPDSFVQANGADGFQQFVAKEKKDFIPFKANKLLEDVQNDPIRKTEVIRDIVTSVSKIPDSIKRSLYLKDCSNLLDIDETILINELNKLIGKKLEKEQKFSAQDREAFEQASFTPPPQQAPPVSTSPAISFTHEKDIIRSLIEFGHMNMVFKAETENEEDEKEPVAEYILNELEDAEFKHPVFKKIWDYYCKQISNGHIPKYEELTNSQDFDIQEMTIELTMSKYEISNNWFDKHEIVVTTREDNFQLDIENSVARFRLVTIERMIKENQEQLKHVTEVEDMMKIQKQHLQYVELKKKICDFLGNVIP